MKTLAFFLVLIFGCIPKGHTQQSLVTDYLVHPKFDAKKGHVKTREVVACARINGNLINNSGDTTLEHYSEEGKIMLIRSKRAGGSFSADDITTHKFTYDQKDRILTDSTWVDGNLLVKSYSYDDKKQQAEMKTYPNWADSSVKVIFYFQGNRICRKIGIDAYGDTIYRYKNNGDAETEELWKRQNDSLQLTYCVTSIYDPKTRTKNVMSYDIAGDRTAFRLERHIYDDQDRLVKSERYEEEKASLIEEFTYTSQNLVSQKTEYTYTDSTVSVVTIVYNYSGQKVSSVRYYSSRAAEPFTTVEYMYDQNGLLVEQRTTNGEKKVTKCYSYRYTFY